jgi:hypothetical protein
MTALYEIKSKEKQHEEAEKRIKAAISGTSSGNLFNRFKQVIEGRK